MREVVRTIPEARPVWTTRRRSRRRSSPPPRAAARRRGNLAGPARFRSDSQRARSAANCARSTSSSFRATRRRGSPRAPRASSLRVALAARLAAHRRGDGVAQSLDFQFGLRQLGARLGVLRRASFQLLAERPPCSRAARVASSAPLAVDALARRASSTSSRERPRLLLLRGEGADQPGVLRRHLRHERRARAPAAGFHPPRTAQPPCAARPRTSPRARAPPSPLRVLLLQRRVLIGDDTRRGARVLRRAPRLARRPRSTPASAAKAAGAASLASDPPDAERVSSRVVGATPAVSRRDPRFHMRRLRRLRERRRRGHARRAYAARARARNHRVHPLRDTPVSGTREARTRPGCVLLVNSFDCHTAGRFLPARGLDPVAPHAHARVRGAPPSKPPTIRSTPPPSRRRRRTARLPGAAEAVGVGDGRRARGAQAAGHASRDGGGGGGGGGLGRVRRGPGGDDPSPVRARLASTSRSNFALVGDAAEARPSSAARSRLLCAYPAGTGPRSWLRAGWPRRRVAAKTPRPRRDFGSRRRRLSRDARSTR